MIFHVILVLTINHALAASTSLVKRARQDYIIGRELGRGSFAVVYRAERKFDGLTVAIKQVPNGIEKVENEVEIMKVCLFLLMLNISGYQVALRRSLH